MSDDPYKAPENSSALKMVTNQKQRSAVIFLANAGVLAAAWWLVGEKHRELYMNATLFAILFADTIWSFVWPVIKQVDED